MTSRDCGSVELAPEEIHASTEASGINGTTSLFYGWTLLL